MCGLQEPNYMTHHLMFPRVNSSRKHKVGAGPGPDLSQETLVGDMKVVTGDFTTTPQSCAFYALLSN